MYFSPLLFLGLFFVRYLCTDCWPKHEYLICKLFFFTFFYLLICGNMFATNPSNVIKVGDQEELCYRKGG